MNFKKCHPVILAAAVLLFAAGCSKSPEKMQAEKAAVEAQTTGRLLVKSNLANTTIEATLLPANGESAPSGVNGVEGGAAEHSLARLPLGNYVITARAAGWPDLRQEADVVAGQTTAVAITFTGGSLRLDSLPVGATVKRGNVVLGKTPLVAPQLPPGEHSLSIEYPLWPALPFKTTITEGVETTEIVRLPHGKLVLESSPAGATVLLGKRPIGQTPLTIERYQAGTTKLTLQAKDFPPLEVTVAMEDRGELKLSPELGTGFPELEPEGLLRAVWIPDNPDRLSPLTEGISGPFQPQNGIVKNLHRKRLYEVWLRKPYRFSAPIKAYDPVSGQVEFVEQQNALSRHRVLAKLSPEARSDQALATRLFKGATFSFYGQLSAVEEPRWPSKVITFEFRGAEPLR